jgi:hypothetical protein
MATVKSLLRGDSLPVSWSYPSHLQFGMARVFRGNIPKFREVL